MRKTRTTHRSIRGSRRGIALLLVMIGLVVCTILTAGFLSSQGTSLGIARNESSAERARAVAQSGLEMCIWMVKNRTDWRTSLQPGTWLNGFSVGGGTVTVTAADGDNSGSFSDDTRQSVVFTSTGTYDSRTYTLSATVTPTGGGTVFKGGSFFSGSVQIGQGSSSSAVVDSYNSSLAAYNASSPGSNAIVWTNLTSSGAVSIGGSSVLRGSVTVGPGATLGSSVTVNSGATGPTSTAAAAESRASGTVMTPNPANTLTDRGSFNKTGGTYPVTSGGVYSQITLNTSGSPTTMNIGSTGVVRCTGNLTLNSGCVIGVQDACNVTLQVDGNTTISGNIKIYGSGTLTIVANGSVTIKNSATVNAPSGVAGTPSVCIIQGTANSTQFYIQNSAIVSAAVYTPAADMQMTGSGTTPKFYGAAVAKSLLIDNYGQFHFDEALKTAALHNIYNGSAPTGTADYTISVNESGTLRGTTVAPTVTIHTN